MSIEGAARIIAANGGYGDPNLPYDEYEADDRRARLEAAVFSELIDEVFEHFVSDHYRLPFANELVESIARLIATAMMAQHEHTETVVDEANSAISEAWANA
jgi:hypothetical protein